jgi:hypothetical protein
MTATRATTLSPQFFDRGAVRRTSQFNRGLTFVVALYLAVAILELSIVVHAAPPIAELNALYGVAP